MFRLFGRLLAALVVLFGFSVFAAWAWDRSDHTAPVHAQHLDADPAGEHAALN